MFSSCSGVQCLVSVLTILRRNSELVTLLWLSSKCLVSVSTLWLFFTVRWVCLYCVVVVFPGHIHLLYYRYSFLFNFDSRPGLRLNDIEPFIAFLLFDRYRYSFLFNFDSRPGFMLNGIKPLIAFLLSDRHRYSFLCNFDSKQGKERESEHHFKNRYPTKFTRGLCVYRWLR